MLNSNSLSLSPAQIDYVLSPVAIRAQAQKIFALTEQGHTAFRYHPENFQATVDYVLEVIHKNYPDLQIPFHSRWGHFRVGKIDRPQQLKNKLASLTALERARTELDLVISSVLLDAGAGPGWTYREKSSQLNFSRSEGLGVASFHMFFSGVLSSDRKSLRADREGLKAVSADDLREYFQVSATNPLVGVEGRVLLLNNLATALENTKIFREGRPGNIIDYLAAEHGQTIPATAILRAVLEGLGPIWPGRVVASGVNLGDVWSYPKLGAAGTLESLVPIHKLSQWMTYSLIEPIVDAGFTVSGVEQLTGLAEYRNGGLMLDANLLSLVNADDAHKSWKPSSELIIEWRALTLVLLDLIGAAVQKALHKNPQEFPLAKVLEGGTWWAGRFLAQAKRPGATPPLQIESDGTVF